MPSPFPGMDPYLEGPATWPGLHHRLISVISNVLQPQLLPAYYSEIGERVYIEDVRHSIYPDVGIFRSSHPGVNEGGTSALVSDEPTLVTWDTRHREPYLEIRTTHSNELVAVLEVLSPSNKSPGANGREAYRRKQDEVLGSRVHLIEIDLLRSGAPTVMAPPGRLFALPAHDYLVCVCRAQDRGQSELYAVSVRERLPRVRVPLRPPDPDVVLDLPQVFAECYEEGGYAYRIDYSQQPPQPELRFEDREWLDARLREAGLRAG